MSWFWHNDLCSGFDTMFIGISAKQPTAFGEGLHLSRDWDPILVCLWKRLSGDSPSQKVTKEGKRKLNSQR